MLKPPKRPLRITLLLWLVLIVTAWNLVRLFAAIDWKNTLEKYYYSPQGVLYVGLTGAFWALVGIFVLWCYRRGGQYTRLIFLVTAGLYAAWYWIDRLFIQSTPQSNWLFALAVTVLLLGFTGFVVLDPRNLPYFRRETHERKRENQSAT
jgi:hypothetical protein